MAHLPSLAQWRRVDDGCVVGGVGGALDESTRRWRKAKGGSRYAQCLIARGHEDVDLCRHARLELELRILDAEHYVIHDHVLHGRWYISDLPDAALESATRVGINAKKAVCSC